MTEIVYVHKLNCSTIETLIANILPWRWSLPSAACNTRTHLHTHTHTYSRPQNANDNHLSWLYSFCCNLNKQCRQFNRCRGELDNAQLSYINTHCRKNCTRMQLTFEWVLAGAVSLCIFSSFSFFIVFVIHCFVCVVVPLLHFGHANKYKWWGIKSHYEYIFSYL